MSETAVYEFNEARVRQTTQNDARQIRTKVEAALRRPLRSGARWPFELVQNAHDAGPRGSDEQVGIDFSLRDGELVVSHTGKPFDSKELAALLSGGSSKGFDNRETAGRFGTGFLVTHGVSPFVTVEGVLATQEGNEHFCMKLVRDGDEAAIVDNIADAERALQNASVVTDSWVAENPTASFTYHDPKLEVVGRGLERLNQAMPYLYGTCERLGEVRVSTPDGMTKYTPGDTTESMLRGFLLRRTDVVVSRANGYEAQLFVSRITAKDGMSALLAVSDRHEGQHRLVAPSDDFPRLFVTFPIAGTHFLPFNVVVDGQFTPQQERDGISMDGRDRQRFRGALSALPSLVRHAIESDWVCANQLAWLALPDRTLSGEGDSDERQWWEDVIREIATATASEPIIETKIGQLPAVSKDCVGVASFLVPAFDADSDAQFDSQQFHELATVVKGLRVPSEDVAPDWERIARDWNEAGVPVDRLGVKELTDRVRSASDSICGLPIDGDPFQWLASLMLLVAELDEDYNPGTLVDGLVPDQHGQLRNTRDLRIDDSIPEEIKDIAQDAGIALRSQLLHNDIWEALNKPGYENASDLISSLLGESVSTMEAIERVLERLDSCLPSDGTLEESPSLPLLRSSARLAVYLVSEEDARRLRRCPLLTAADTIVRLTGSQQILAPVHYWSQTQQPYADLYTEGRILSQNYCDDPMLNQVLHPLISARLVIPSPLYEGIRPEIEDINLLNAMSSDGQDMTNVTIRNESFGQIAFLSTDLVQRCGRDPNLAKSLLEFVLKVAAREDRNWKRMKNARGTAVREQIQRWIPGATWPFELKVRSWVPVRLSEELEAQGYAPTPANETNLRELYEASWFRGNSDAVELLHQVFGIRRLTLMIDELDSGEESDLVELLGDQGLLGSAVRNRDLLKSAEENPAVAKLLAEVAAEEVQDIREALEERKAQSELRESNRKFGHDVQRVLAEAIEEYGPNLVLEDRGFDYEVFPGSLNCSLDDASFSFKVGSYYLEVKATTTGDVRLTPLQAQTASESPRRFVLCVIDLRDAPARESWDPMALKPYVRFVSDIGDEVVDVYESVDSLTEAGQPVRLRNEKQLRYGVSESLWRIGISIDEWVDSLKDQLE